MQERPILFSAPMVRALLDGRKTQTRRLVKPQPSKPICRMVHVGTCTATGRKSFVAQDIKGQCVYAWPSRNGYGIEGDIAAPYAVGDRLWVRESYYQLGHWEEVAGQVTRKGNRQKWRFVPDSDEIRFDAPPEFRKGRHHKDPGASVWHKRLARFMPRAISRLTLEVTAVRVERLQDISEEDAIAEGIEPVPGGYRNYMPERESLRSGLRPSASFHSLWESIYGTESLANNEWVWACEFKQVPLSISAQDS